jgi:hypothetical protein
MLFRRLCGLLLATLVPLGCVEHEGPLPPVGGEEATDVELTRYVRRLYLDTTGVPPTERTTSATLNRLKKEGNTAAARGALVDDLLALKPFATQYVAELENKIFAGDSTSDTYAFFCGILRGDPACASCSSPDVCDCSCPAMAPLKGERDALLASWQALLDGAATSKIERSFAESSIFRFNAGAPESVAASLFDHFLGRPSEPTELANAKVLVIGAIFPGTPAGLLFHRHGANYADLVDIIFTSEVYREAAVDSVFLRYLGRQAAPIELAAFTKGLDAAAPDVRPVIRAVVSSREYFAQ